MVQRVERSKWLTVGFVVAVLVCSTARTTWALEPIRNFISHSHVVTTTPSGVEFGEVWEYFMYLPNGSLTRDDVIWAVGRDNVTRGNWSSWTPCTFNAPTDTSYVLSGDGRCSKETKTREELENCVNEFERLSLVANTSTACIAAGQRGTLFRFAMDAVELTYCMRSPTVVLAFNVSDRKAGFHQEVVFYYFSAMSAAMEKHLFDIPPACLV